MLHSKENIQTIAIYNSMNVSWKYNVKQKKSHTKTHMPYDSICGKLKSRQHSSIVMEVRMVIMFGRVGDKESYERGVGMQVSWSGR